MPIAGKLSDSTRLALYRHITFRLMRTDVQVIFKLTLYIKIMIFF